MDRQRNQLNHGKLTYCLDYDDERETLKAHMEDRLGFRRRASPGERGESGILPDTQIRIESGETREKILRPNETVMIELQLRRWVDTAVFQLSNERDPKNTELLRKEPIDKKRRKKDVQ